MGQYQLEVLGNEDRRRLNLTPWCTQELVKHTQDATEKENLRLALDAMRVREQVLLGTRAGRNLSASTGVGGGDLLPLAVEGIDPGG